MNKSLFCRIALILLSLLMVVGASACTKENEKDPKETQEKETVEPSLIDQLPTVTYNNDDFTFLIRDMEEYFPDVIVEEISATSREVDKAVFERNEAIMERYEVDFKYVKKKQGTEFLAEVTNAIAGGSDVYDVVVGHGREIFTGVIAAQYADWNDMEYLSLESEWWNQSARASFATPGGKLFAMNGDLSYQSVGTANCMFFNKTMLSDAGLASPYDLVEKNEWTLANFMQLAKDVDATLAYNDVDDIKNGSFGYATQRYRGPYYAIYSSGGQGLVLQEDGTYTIGFSEQRVGDAFSQYRTFLLESGAAFWGPNDADLEPIRQAFAAETVCFTDDNIRNAISFKGTGIDFGIVPWPKYESTDSYTAKIGSGTNTFAVLKNTSADNLSRVGLILEAMAVYGHVDVISYYFDTILSLQAAQDKNTYEMLQIIHDCLTVDFAAYTNFGGIADLGQNILKKPEDYGTSLSVGVTVIRDSVMANLEVWYVLDILTNQ